MKIVFLASGTVNSTLTYRILSFAKSLTKLGNQVTIIAPSYDKYSKFNKEQINCVEGVNIIRPYQFFTKYRWFNFLPYIFHLMVILITIDAKIIHLYKPTPITVCGILCKFLRKIPLVVDMDDLGSKVMEQEKNNFVVSKFVYICEIISLASADGIICASSFLTNIYKKKYDSKVIWIPNGIEDIEVLINKNDSNNVNLFVIGSLNRNSIIEPLIKALPDVIIKLKNISIDLKVLIFGEGRSVEYLKNMISINKIDDYVVFKGWVNRDVINNYARLGDVGYAYMPDEETIKASSNLKLFQYMSMGVVPIVSDVGDLPFYVGQGEYGYIAKKNDQISLTNTLVDIFKNKNERVRKAETCIEYVRLNYSWFKLTKKVENFYQELLNSNE